MPPKRRGFVPPRVTVEKLSSVDVERQVPELVGAEVPLATVEPQREVNDDVAEVEVAAVEDDHGLGGQFAVDEPDPG